MTKRVIILIFLLTLYFQVQAQLQLEKCNAVKEDVSIKFIYTDPRDTNNIDNTMKYLAVSLLQYDVFARFNDCGKGSLVIPKLPKHITRRIIPSNIQKILFRNDITKTVRTRDYTFVGTQHKDGLEIYDKLGKMVSNKMNKIREEINQLTNQIYDIYLETEDFRGDKNTVWLATGNGLFRIYIHQNRYKHYFKGQTITSIKADFGYLWFVAQEEAYENNQRTFQSHIYKLKISEIDNPEKSNTIKAEALDKQNISQIISMDFDSYGRLWLLTDSNLYVYNESTDEVEFTETDKLNFTYLFIDKHKKRAIDRVWLGTRSNGLFYIDADSIDNARLSIEDVQLTENKNKLKILCEISGNLNEARKDDLIFEVKGKSIPKTTNFDVYIRWKQKPVQILLQRDTGLPFDNGSLDLTIMLKDEQAKGGLRILDKKSYKKIY